MIEDPLNNFLVDSFLIARDSAQQAFEGDVINFAKNAFGSGVDASQGLSIKDVASGAADCQMMFDVGKSLFFGKSLECEAEPEALVEGFVALLLKYKAQPMLCQKKNGNG